MGRIDKVGAVAGIALIASQLYDAHLERKRKQEERDKDKQIKVLQDELAKLKEAK